MAAHGPSGVAQAREGGHGGGGRPAAREAHRLQRV